MKTYTNISWGMGLLLALLTGACVQEPEGIVFTCPAPSPQVARTSPAAGDTGVARNTVVTATFNTRMDSSSFTPGSVVLLLGLDTIPGALSYAPADTTVRFVPADTLRPDTTYTVFISSRVRDTAGAAMSTPYAWVFTTSGGAIPPSPDTAPPAPTLIAPPDGSTGVLPVATALSWNAAPRATTYRLQVSTSPLFTTTVFDAAGLNGTSQLVVGLLPLGTYYWRVNASNSAGTSPWSTVWNFSTLP